MKFYIEYNKLGEEDYSWEPETRSGTFSEAKEALDNTLLAIADATRTEDFRIFIGGSNNFRDKVATLRPYKGRRDRSLKPTHFYALRDYLLNEWSAEVIDGMEADDALGINHTTDTIVCTIDKDLQMIPGWNYNWVTGDMRLIGESEATRFFYMQLLTGDNTDNIQGVVGIGTKRATALLSECETEKEMFDVCLKAYKNNYEELLENGTLLWIKRTELDDEFKHHIEDFL